MSEEKGKGPFESYSKEHVFVVKKPEIDEKVKNIIELISKNGNKSIIEYILTLDQYNTLDQYKEKQAEILNYLLIWAIQEKNKDIINILIDEKNAKLNTGFEEDSEIVRSVVRNLSFYGEVIENIRKSIVPEITKEGWKGLIEDYTNNQKSPEKDEPPKQAVKKPEIDEKVKNIIELISKNGNKSIIEYILTLDQYNTLDQYKEKQAEILNYLLIWAIEKNEKDIINILIDKKNAKLNEQYEKDRGAISYVLARMNFFEDVFDKIKMSIPFEDADWDNLIEEYKNDQIKVEPPPNIAGGGGDKRKQYGGFRKKHKNTKYKTKKFKKIYKKKKHNRKTRKYK